MNKTANASEAVKDKKPNITFIGLGNMGAPMAQNLLTAGYALSVYDLSPAATERLQQAGASVADSPQQAAANAQVVISMLPAGEHVLSVYLGSSQNDAEPANSEGLLSHLSKDTLVIDSSTIAAADARQVADAARTLGIDFLDAPVSGGTGGAIAGSLTFIVGGEAEAFAKAKPILASMGKNIFHAGASGAGQVAKIDLQQYAAWCLNDRYGRGDKPRRQKWLRRQSFIRHYAAKLRAQLDTRGL